MGLFDRKRPNAAAVRRVKACVTEQLCLPGTATVTVAELACHEPGCPPIETVVTVQDVDGQRRMWRLHKPIAEITAADVAAAIPDAAPEPTEEENTMTDTSEAAHAEHLAQAQDHYRWRRDHLEALAILKRAEAAIFAHEARILAHDAEIARHEEQIDHGDAHADAPPAGEHARFTHDHAAGAEHHNTLLDAIRALDAHIKD